MNAKLLEKIAETRNELEGECTFFPMQCCGISSRKIKDIFGFQIMMGEFLVGNIRYGHSWNVTKRGEIVDITADQFGDFQKVYVLKKDSKEAREHYVERVHVYI